MRFNRTKKSPPKFRNCIICSTRFKFNKARIKTARFCSIKCRSLGNTGEKNPSWKGGFYIDKNGYRRIYMPKYPTSNYNGYILEHRYVMEKSVNRLLFPWEVVHHKNGIKADNRIENLELVTSARNLMYKNSALKCPKCGHLFNEIT